jgi:hypothetical protein
LACHLLAKKGPLLLASRHGFEQPTRSVALLCCPPNPVRSACGTDDSRSMEDTFVYLAQWRVLMCMHCGCCLKPKESMWKRHLRSDPHSISGHALKGFVQRFQSCDLISLSCDSETETSSCCGSMGVQRVQVLIVSPDADNKPRYHQEPCITGAQIRETAGTVLLFLLLLGIVSAATFLRRKQK